MASDTNQVVVIGRLTRDPELRSLASGAAVADLSIACNSTRKNRSTEEWEDNPSFFTVKAWSREPDKGLAHTVTKYCNKGDRVCVTGRLEQQTWEADNGGKRERVEIVANSVQFISSPQGRSQEQAPAETNGEVSPF